MKWLRQHKWTLIISVLLFLGITNCQNLDQSKHSLSYSSYQIPSDKIDRKRSLGSVAIGSGGLFGKGFGSSIQKLGFVPEAQNDMIFSIICEELGLVGASFVLLLFLILIWRFFVIASHAPDLEGALIASGAMAHMMIQVILNIAVVTNTIPNTGITLPFISYGGTSVMFLLFEMGLVLNVSSLVK